MRIAICDSDHIFAADLKHILYNYSNKKGFDFFIETFKSGEELLNSKNEYFLIFLEYSLPGINGIETAKKLRQLYHNARIIFLSDKTSYIFETFKVNAYTAFTKPLSEDLLTSTLNELFYSTATHCPIWISDGFNIFCTDTEQILYLEACNKHCLVHLCDKTILCKKTMARVYEALPKNHFQKINRAFIINLNYIEKYNPDFVSLNNGEKLPVTRTYYKFFKENYLKYTRPEVI